MQWDVEKLANGYYCLKNGGAIVGGANGRLFAFLIPDQATTATTEWIFRADERRASEGDAYVCVLPSRLRVSSRIVELTLTCSCAQHLRDTGREPRWVGRAGLHRRRAQPAGAFTGIDCPFSH